jgi:hypothetical protein
LSSDGLTILPSKRRMAVSYTYWGRPLKVQDKIFEFKVEDYTTLMVGRLHFGKDFYESYAYVQRGDGTIYRYSLDRLTYLEEVRW